jgi:hypothetical protein
MREIETIFSAIARRNRHGEPFSSVGFLLLEIPALIKQDLSLDVTGKKMTPAEN